jgi:uncharacterized protein
MKKLILVLLLSIPSFLNTQAATKQENIKALFTLMQTDSMAVKMMNSMMPMLMNPASTVKDSTARVQREAMLKKITGVMMDITKRLMNEDMTALYDKYYSEKDIKDLLAFYKSDAGKKMVKITPDLNKEMIMILVTKYLPEIQRSITN